MIPNISAVVITRNEEEMIGECIDSLLLVTNDIIIIDSGSTDRTEEICKSKGVRFYFKEWGGYSVNKNFGNEKSNNDWILSIDADERISPELAQSIENALQDTTNVAFDIRFKNNFCGKWIHYGSWITESHVRLFNKNKVKWGGSIHETLEINGSVGKLKGFINHYTVRNMEKYIEKKNQYTSLQSNQLYKRGKKAPFYKIYLGPVFKFVSDYFFRLGFLDGFHGYLIAQENAHYVFLKYSKLKLLYMNGNNDTKNNELN